MSKYTWDRPAPSPDLARENAELRDKIVTLQLQIRRLRWELDAAKGHEAAIRAIAEALQPYLPTPEYDGE